MRTAKAVTYHSHEVFQEILVDVLSDQRLPPPSARIRRFPFTSGEVRIVAIVEWGLFSPSLRHKVKHS